MKVICKFETNWWEKRTLSWFEARFNALEWNQCAKKWIMDMKIMDFELMRWGIPYRKELNNEFLVQQRSKISDSEID